MNDIIDIFPHEKIRPQQEKFVKVVKEALIKKRNLIVHAPTGLGKTAAAISPSLAFALKKGMTIFYLTSRQTQHKIVVDTLRKIKNKHHLNFIATDIIGKKNMCSLNGAPLLNAADFQEYCIHLKEKGICEKYNKTKKEKNLSIEAKKEVADIISLNPLHAEEVVEKCKELCPYYLSIELAKISDVIIADYNFIFNEKIRKAFFNQTQKNLENCIIIVDEAHNLPERIKNSLSEKISSVILRRAIKEVKKVGIDILIPYLSTIQEIINSIAEKIEGEEGTVLKEELINEIEKHIRYEDLIEELLNASEIVKESKKRSALSSIIKFLEAWKGPEEGFTRIISINKDIPSITLSYKCLDPAVVSEKIVSEAYSTIFMSGTMKPTDMYKEILGIKSCDEYEYESPFPRNNRLDLIVPITTTKFNARNDKQFKKIAEICAEMINIIPGNVAIFFPSYNIKDKVLASLSVLSRKTIFSEMRGLTKKEKKELLEEFSAYKNKGGAVLMAVTSGSFGEGIDLPGILSGVIVVGLPLKMPDLETKETIRYYEENFRKGWEYGYIFPAINKALQAAGRCVRSEKDKGVIVFLDERYIWPNYLRCFPENYEVTKNYNKKIIDFFSQVEK
ncbi:MAG: ATP-dependent DNA helicase [Candidatus Woesearchaeota archaeon]